VDFAGHCNQINVFLKLVFFWRVLSVSMIVGEPKWASSLGEGWFQLWRGLRWASHLGILCLIRGIGPRDLLGFIMTRVEQQLKMMFSQRY